MDELVTRVRREQRWMYVTAILLFLLSLVFAGREYFLGHINGNWRSLRSEVHSGQANVIQRQLATLLQELEQQSALLLAVHPETLLEGMNNPRSQADAIRQLMNEAPASLWSFELRKSDGELVAFSGEPISSREPGTGGETSAIQPGFHVLHRTPYLLLTRTVLVMNAENVTLGTLRLGTPLTITVPLNRRFIAAKGFIGVLSEKLEMDLAFSRSRPDTEDDAHVQLPFLAEEDTLGWVSFPVADRDTYIQHIGLQFDRIIDVLLLAILLVFSIPVFRISRRLSPLPAVLTQVLFIWLIRGFLLCIDFAGTLFPGLLLDPAYYASTFGWGLTDAPGELLLSLLALLLSTVRIYHTVLETRDQTAGVRSSTALFVLVFATLPFVLRGFAASLHSFVIDSTFNYDDIAGFLEHPMFLLMIANAFLLSLALGFGLVGMYLMVKKSLGHIPSQRTRLLLLLSGITGSIALLLLTTQDLLLPLWSYILIELLFCVPVIVRVPPIRGRSDSLLAPFAVATVFGSALTIALIGHFMESKRNSEIEAIAIDLARPVDGWSQVLMEQTLQYVSRSRIEELPGSAAGETSDYEAAFRIWAGSPLSRLQNNSAILLLDSTMALRSRFAVGNDPFLLSMHTLSSTIESTEGIIQSTYRWQETRGRRYLRAYTDIPTGRLGVLTAVVVLEALDPMQMTRQAVDLLRNTASNLSLAPEDDFIISRFRDGRIVQTTDPRLERSIRLPADVRNALTHGEQTVWSALPVEGDLLDSYFMVAPDPRSEVLAITRGKSVLILSIYRGLRIAVLFLIFSAILLAGTALVTGRFRRISRFTFARKLQLALLAVAAIPLLVIWVTGRDFVIENTRREIEQQVIDDLDVLRSNLLERLPDSIAVTALPSFVSDQICQEIRLRSGKDINVYRGSELVATSKPELYKVGLLSNRLNPQAWITIVLLGRDVHFASEQIADFAYSVGYRAIRDTEGRLSAVISTPTLFRRGQVEKGYVRASATIFLWITIIALLVLAVSGMLARQISRPLQELLRATRDITAGDLSRRVDVRGSAEIVDLMDSFNTMTARLRQSQEELAAAERELAWKEMAKQVAHEIRNPLTPMKLAIQHLHRAWQDGAAQLGDIIEKVTRTLVDQIDSLSRISDEFSRFARMPRRSTAEVDVATTVAEAVSLFRSHDQITFDLDVETGLPPVLADREELARAFTNILRNAVQAIRGAGRVEIRLRRMTDGIRLTVADSGSGIPAELLPRIFEPNFSTKTEGMGLGLAIVKKIIDDAGGSIHIESASGKGTTVTIHLPAVS
ncbi:MAG: HAMP domain-containing protein [Bacteroidetes bacterium]|nr:HAMP domain-containing protein [Bacteroidota bacterium]